ncbi:MAG: beta-glucuronidase, partial [Prevotella sp.]|nr:beta-glucuronidase [Prevotella sp.]
SNYQTEVWLNGQYVGQHVGGFTPFAFDITSHLHKGENTLVVRVNNQRRPEGVPTINSDWWNYGGLTRDVMLVETPMAHIDDYEVKLSKGSYEEIYVKARLNLAVADVKVDVRIPELGVMAQLRTNNQGVAEARLAAKPELWSPDRPKLYDVVLRCNGEEMDDDIGFRHIETDGRKVLLNGKQVFLRGVSVHEEAPFRSGRCCTEQDDSTLISWAKFMGCNMLRLAHYPHNEQMVRMAEREGIMLWSEVPVYWTIDWNNQETYNNAARQLRDNILRDHNRCAIIIWSVANETPRSEARNHFLRGLAKVVKDHDDERLLSMAMETETHDDITTVEDALSDLVDILSFNCYLGWYGGKPSDCEKRRWFFAQEKPFFVSEFGAGAVAGRFGSKDEKWTEEYQAEVYRKTLAMYDKVPGFAGCSPWILMDFRSPRRQNHETQQYYNRKGLVSDRGQTKQAFYVMQDFYKKKGAFKRSGKK